MSLILGIDTADVVGSVALLSDEGKLALSSFQVPPSYAEVLAREIFTLLKSVDADFSELTGIAVSSGPGSFTGLRIGASTALGISAGLEIPIVAVETLPAWAAAMGLRGEVLCPILNAGKGLIFFALFKWEENGLVRVTEDLVLEPKEFCRTIEHTTLVWGSGAERHREFLESEVGRCLRFISRDRWPAAAAKVASNAEFRIRNEKGDSPAGFQLRYIREAEARVQWNRRYFERHSKRP